MSNDRRHSSPSRIAREVLQAIGIGSILLLLAGCVIQAPSESSNERSEHHDTHRATSTPEPTHATTSGGIPQLNATCPGGYDVHADEGGPVYINGNEARLHKSNDNYYEATGSGITVSLSRNADGSFSLSYTGAHGANGICQLSGG